MEKDTSEETSVKFTHTIDDEKAKFSMTLDFILTPHGPLARIENGPTEGASYTVAQGEIEIQSLRDLLSQLKDEPDADVETITVQMCMASYDEEERGTTESIGELPIPITGPMSFRPYLLKYLPHIIRLAEMLEAENKPVMNTAAKPALC